MKKAKNLFLAVVIASLVVLGGCGKQSPNSPNPSASYYTLELEGSSAQAALLEVAYNPQLLQYQGIVESKVVFQAKEEQGRVRLGFISSEKQNGTLLRLQFRLLKSGGEKPNIRYLEQVGNLSVRWVASPSPKPPLDTQAFLASLTSTPQSVPGAGQEDLQPEFVLYPLGDVNRNGGVTAVDALQILRFALGSLEPQDAHQRYHADLNSSGTISTIDAVIALRKAVDTQLEAGLEVAPPSIRLNGQTPEAYVLVGNSGNLPLNRPQVSSSPGIEVQDITPDGAQGYAYRLRALSSVSNGAVAFDGGEAGRRTVLVNAVGISGCPDGNEPNDDPTRATPITPGVYLAGICSAGDVDFYRFTLAQGQVVSLEILARRLNPDSQLDSVLVLYSERGNGLLYHDDLSDTRDSRVFIALPPGTYYLGVYDYDDSGSEEHFYRLVFAVEEVGDATFEGQAGTLVSEDPRGGFDGNLFQVAGYRNGGSPLPFGWYVSVEAPNGGVLETAFNHPAHGSPGYETYAYFGLDFGSASLGVQGQPFRFDWPKEKGRSPSAPAGSPIRRFGAGKPGVGPSAALGGRFVLKVGTATLERTVDLSRKLPSITNLTVEFDPSGLEAIVRLDPVAGAVEYTAFVYQPVSGCSGLGQSTSTEIRVSLGCALREGSEADVGVVAANFRGLVTSPLPVPSEQMDASQRIISQIVTFGNSIQGTVSQGLPETSGAVAGPSKSPEQTLGTGRELPTPNEVLVLLQPLRQPLPLAEARESFQANVQALATAYGLEYTGKGAPRLGLAVFRTGGEDPEQVASRLSLDARVRAASPNYPRYRLSVPNDPLFPYLWGLWGVVGAPAAWSTTTGSANVVVAVLDTGMGGPEHAGTSGNPAVDSLARKGYHPDLLGNLVEGFDFVSCYDVSDYLPPDLLSLYPRLATLDADDQCGPDPYPIEEYQIGWSGVEEWGSHGTHVAGTIGAMGNNGQGVVGVNWQVLIQPIRVLGTLGGFSSDILLGALYASGEEVEIGGEVIQNPTPARVINMSLGGPGYSPVEEAIYESIYQERNVLIVAAAGNDSSRIPSYPAGYPAVMAVSSVDFIKDLDGDPSNGTQPAFAFSKLFSNFGSHIDIAAPGGLCWESGQGYVSQSWDLVCQDMPFILSTVWRWYQGGQRIDREEYGFSLGTSMASPHVAGAAALLLSLNPNLTAYQLRELLRQTATDIDDGALLGPGQPGRDDYYGWGVLNVAAAVEAVRTGRLPRQPVGSTWVRARSEQTGETFLTRANPEGFYSFPNLPNGTYRVEGWVDLNGNEQWDSGEPRGEYPEAIVLTGSTLAGNISFVLR